MIILNNINDIKYRIKNKKKSSSAKENQHNFMLVLRRFIFKCLIVAILTLTCLILSKKSVLAKNIIYNKVYDSYISFPRIKKIYNKYLGNILPFENINIEKPVFNNETIKYKEKSAYDSGVKLILENNYVIPIINDGMVIFIGEKENLGKTLIIEDSNKINYIYGNLENINVKLYDYVNKGDLLGSSKDNTLYLLFEKDGKYLDYKEFIK